MSPTVDFGTIVERDFSPVEDGVYNARLTGYDLIEPAIGDLNAKGKQKMPYYNCEYTADRDQFVNEEGVEPDYDRKFWKVISIGPEALWAFKKDVLALGADPTDMQPGTPVDTDEIMASVLEAPCRIALKKVTYPKRDGTQGEKSEIQEVMPALPF